MDDQRLGLDDSAAPLVLFSAAEINACLPPEARYLVRIEAISVTPSCSRPERVDLALRVLHPRGLATWIYDSFPIRDCKHADPAQRLCAMRRLLELLYQAGVKAQADRPIQLGTLRGAQLLVDVRREPGRTGFPTSRITSYAAPASFSRTS